MSKTIQPSELLSARELKERIWQELTRCALDKHHEWRSPVLSTVGLDGTPQARTVVLRQANKAAQTITIFTDKRTPKVAELVKQPSGVITCWSKRLGWQCRISLQFQVLTEGSEVDAAWLRISRSPAAKDYLAALPPGTPLVEKGDAPSSHQLAVLIGHITAIDWLELGVLAHRRIKFVDDSWLELVA
jgi:pyridoxamine 5'-phosphate oxidase